MANAEEIIQSQCGSPAVMQFGVITSATERFSRNCEIVVPWNNPWVDVDISVFRIILGLMWKSLYLEYSLG